MAKRVAGDRPTRNHRWIAARALLVLGALAPALALTAAPAEAAASPTSTFVVTSTADDTDNNINDGVCATTAGGCTLRAAIVQANRNVGPNRVEFAIPGPGVHTIQLVSSLPAITDTTGGLTIDGYTQPGSAPNTDPLVSNAVITVEVRGIGQQQGTASFSVTSRGNTFRGLAAYNAFYDIAFLNANADGNAVLGSFIGTNAAGTFAETSAFTLGAGLWFYNGASANVVGSPDLADRNVISGNKTVGVKIEQFGSTDNVVQNNLVGLNPSGTAKLANNSGFDLQWKSARNIIGGTGRNERNVISGNSYAGVDLSHTTMNNVVIGNLIGTVPDGTRAQPWSANADGLMIKDNPSGNTITENVLAGNAKNGIWTKHNYTQRNTISRNRIGIGLDGSAIPNQQWGIWLTGQDHIIERNVIANNGSGGIFVSNAVGDNANYPPALTLRNRITANSFVDNAGMSIDVAPAGPNPNDAGDADTGIQDLLNTPELDPVGDGIVSGRACASCTVELYLADGRGAGRQLLGSATADAAGAFAVADPAVTAGRSVTALSIDPAGNTSELAPAVVVGGTAAVPPAALSGAFTYRTVGGRPVAEVRDGTTGTNNGGVSGTANRVRFDLVALAPGTYRIEAEAVAPSNSSDSFWVQVDGVPANGFRWVVSTGSQVHVDDIGETDGADPYLPVLGAGPHTITLAMREDGTGIATVRLVPIAPSTATGLALTAPPDRSDLEQSPIDLPLTATDPDGGVITWSAIGLPPGVSIDARTGRISGTTTIPGTYRVSVLALDGRERATAAFTWTVSPRNRPPSIANPGDRLDAQGAPIEPLTLAGADPDGDVVTWSAVGLPAGLTIDPATGTITGTPTTLATSVSTVTIADPAGRTASTTFAWTIQRAAFSCSVDEATARVSWTDQGASTYYVRHLVGTVETYLGGTSGLTYPATKLYGTYKITYVTGGTTKATTCDGPQPIPTGPPPFTCTVDATTSTVTWTNQGAATYYVRHLVGSVETYLGGTSGLTYPATKLYGTYKITYVTGGTTRATTCDGPQPIPTGPPPFTCTVDPTTSTVTWTNQGATTYYVRRAVNGVETYLGGVSGLATTVSDASRTYTVTYLVGSTKVVTSCFPAALDPSTATLSWADQGAAEYRVARIETDGTETDLGAVAGTTLVVADPTRRHVVSYVAAGTTYRTTVIP